jgi:ACR3 family arsenite efflux pump ArsB
VCGGAGGGRPPPICHILVDGQAPLCDALTMGFLSKLQPVFIILSAITGIIAGKLHPFIGAHAKSFIEIFLMIMLFFVFLNVGYL